MAIDSITITQDNKVGDSDLIPIHSTVTFLADVAYTGGVPDVVHVEIYDDAVLLETYKAIPYRDTLPGVRQFAFIANEPVKSIMSEFDDTFQLIDTFLPVAAITKTLTIRYVDPDTPSTYDEVAITFVHGAAQYGENPNLSDQFNNVADVYYAKKDSFVYVYFYNDDAANTVAIDGPYIVEGNALDYDDAIFTDYDDSNFTIFTLP